MYVLVCMVPWREMDGGTHYSSSVFAFFKVELRATFCTTLLSWNTAGHRETGSQVSFLKVKFIEHIIKERNNPHEINLTT